MDDDDKIPKKWKIYCKYNYIEDEVLINFDNYVSESWNSNSYEFLNNNVEEKKDNCLLFIFRKPNVRFCLKCSFVLVRSGWSTLKKFNFQQDVSSLEDDG